MKNFLTSFLASLAALAVAGFFFFVFSIVFLVGLGSYFSEIGTQSKIAVGPNAILRIELNEPVLDEPSRSVLDQLDPTSLSIRRTVGLFDMINAIEAAEKDPDIKGIFLNINPNLQTGTANLEEIRNALIHFKTSGKFIVSYADFYTQGSYYLASTADSIFLNPAGNLAWNGLSTQTLFFKGLFDKLDVEPEVFRCGAFKSAIEPYTLSQMSAENRTQMELLTQTIWGHIVGEIARARKIDSAELQQYASTLAIENAQKARTLGLVDSLYYNDQVMACLNRLSENDSELNFVSLSDYIRSGASTLKSSKNKIALLYACGTIVDGKGTPETISPITLAHKLEKLRKDKYTKAIVLRVNSPGGSALASEVIWREMLLTQREKPIVVSMGNYAASGGYYIACPADAIVASPTTITGSIGVFGLYVNLEKTLKNKLGITIDGVETNPSAALGTPFGTLSPAERTYLQSGVDQVYETFVDHVSQGRNLSPERVREIGGGHVWSGISAQQIGLVDYIGGLREAIIIAAEKAAITQDFAVTPYLETKNTIELIFNSLLDGSETARSAEATLKAINQSVNPLLNAPSTSNTALTHKTLQQYQYLLNILKQNGSVQAAMPCLVEFN